MRNALFAAVAAAATAACATQAPYQQRTNTDRYGYSEMQLEGNRVRVTYSGDTMTRAETVEAYLLYRSAEATLERGFDYFVIVDHDANENSRYEPTGVRPRFGGVTYREISSHDATAELVMFEGATAPPIPNIYNAHEIVANLRPRVIIGDTQ